MTRAERIDRELAGNVLVFGSPPPEGRDLDLLARPEEYDALARRLAEEGFIERGSEWVRFAGCAAESLDLVPVRAWGLPPPAIDDVFAEARPLPGFRRLVRPAPHHLLLMLARTTAEGDGVLSPKRRVRIERALGENPEVWARAREQAPVWRCTNALQALRRSYESGSRMSSAARANALAEGPYAPGRTPRRARARGWIEVLRPKRRSARLIAFSGLDGAGKSTQAEALRDALRALGVDAEIQWTRVEWTTLWENPLLHVLGAPARAAARFASSARGAGSGAGERAATPVEAADVRERSDLLSNVWVTIVALVHARAQRRETAPLRKAGKVVICDRYTLDSAAFLRFRYGRERSFRFQISLLDRLSPRPLRAYFVDVPPDTAWARKAEQYSLEELRAQSRLYREECPRLRVTRLDGERAPEDLCAQVAEDVWRALRG